MNRERIQAVIQGFADNPKYVHFDDLFNLLENHIKPMFADYNRHGHPHYAFTVGGQTFNIAKPHAGLVKRNYVEHFLAAMEAVGLYTPEK